MILTGFLALISMNFVFLYLIGFETVLELDYGTLLSMGTLQEAPLLAWGILGLPATLFACGTYGVWVCYRLLPRVSAFVGTTSERLNPAKLAPTATTRPVGGILPPVLGWAVITIVIDHTSTLGDTAFVIVWPVVLAGLFGCVVATRRRGEHSVCNEDHVVIWSLLVMLMIWPLLGMTTEALITPFWPLYWVLPVLWLGYFGRVDQIASDADDWRQHSVRLFVFAGGLMHGCLAIIASGITRIGFIFITLVLFSMGIIELWLTD